jgi:hypothetical protein
LALPAREPPEWAPSGCACTAGHRWIRPSGGSPERHVPFAPVTSPRPVQYKGEDLDPARGPGLGCFWAQLVVLAVVIVLTPLSVAWKWPEWLSALLLFTVIVLLLFAGQTIIFLLRLVAADRRSRRRPLGSATKTVGELEDQAEGPQDATERPPDDPAGPSSGEGPVRQ